MVNPHISELNQNTSFCSSQKLKRQPTASCFLFLVFYMQSMSKTCELHLQNIFRNNLTIVYVTIFTATNLDPDNALWPQQAPDIIGSTHNIKVYFLKT